MVRVLRTKGLHVRCLECGTENDSDSKTCVRCGAALVDRPPSAADARARGATTRFEPPAHASCDDFVVVCRPHSAPEQMVAESILRSAEVDFLARGSDVQDLFGIGRFGSGSNLVVGPVEILVRREDAANAAALLANVETSGEGVFDLGDEGAFDSGDEADEQE